MSKTNKNSLLGRCLLAPMRWATQWRQRAFDFQNDALKAQMKKCGEHVSFYGRSRITGAENMTLGHNVHVGENAHIRAEGGLEIGDNVHISRNLVLYTINHNYQGRRLPFEETMDEKPVVIGRNVWIGMNVCIVPGTIIGDGAIISMGTVVSGEVPPLAIIGNQQWHVLKYRDKAHYDKLESTGAYGGRSGMPLEPSGH